MARKVVEIKSEQVMDRKQIAGFLRELADKMDAGQITLRQGDKEAQVEVPEQLELEVELEHKPKNEGRKYSLELEMEWRTGDYGAQVEIA